MRATWSWGTPGADGVNCSACAADAPDAPGEAGLDKLIAHTQANTLQNSGRAEMATAGVEKHIYIHIDLFDTCCIFIDILQIYIYCLCIMIHDTCCIRHNT